MGCAELSQCSLGPHNLRVISPCVCVSVCGCVWGGGGGRGCGGHPPTLTPQVRISVAVAELLIAVGVLRGVGAMHGE